MLLLSLLKHTHSQSLFLKISQSRNLCNFTIINQLDLRESAGSYVLENSPNDPWLAIQECNNFLNHAVARYRLH